MRLQVLIAAVLGWISCAAATSNNLTDLVTWDKYSLTVNGTRVYIRLVPQQVMLEFILMSFQLC